MTKMGPDIVSISKNPKEIYHVQDHTRRTIANLYPNDYVEWASIIKDGEKTSIQSLVEWEIRRSGQVDFSFHYYKEKVSRLIESHLLNRKSAYGYDENISSFLYICEESMNPYRISTCLISFSSKSYFMCYLFFCDASSIRGHYSSSRILSNFIIVRDRNIRSYDSDSQTSYKEDPQKKQSEK